MLLQTLDNLDKTYDKIRVAPYYSWSISFERFYDYYLISWFYARQ